MSHHCADISLNTLWQSSSPVSTTDSIKLGRFVFGEFLFLDKIKSTMHSKQYRLFKKNPFVQSPCNPRKRLSWGCMVIVLKGSFWRIYYMSCCPSWAPCCPSNIQTVICFFELLLRYNQPTHPAQSGQTVRLPVWPWQQVCVRLVEKEGVRASWIFIMTSPVYWLWYGSHSQVRLSGQAGPAGVGQGRGGFWTHSTYTWYPLADNWINEDDPPRLLWQWKTTQSLMSRAHTYVAIPDNGPCNCYIVVITGDVYTLSRPNWFCLYP